MGDRIFLTGASGFVGRGVLDELLGRGYDVHALVNRRPLEGTGERVRCFTGGLFDSSALEAGMASCRAAIHLVGIIREKRSQGITFERMHVEGTQQMVETARRAGVRRLIHMSALGTRPDAASRYHRTKHEAEEAVRRSGLEWTILRPSLIHGPGGEFMQMEAKWARGQAAPFLFMPCFGAGFLGTRVAGRLQPVHVRDVARAFVDALGRPQTIGRVYCLGGTQQLTWRELHAVSARVILGRPRWVVAIPAWKAKMWTRLLPGAWLPFNRDQVIMSQEENTCELTEFERDFGWRPAGFTESIEEYAAQL